MDKHFESSPTSFLSIIANLAAQASLSTAERYAERIASSYSERDREIFVSKLWESLNS